MGNDTKSSKVFWESISDRINNPLVFSLVIAWFIINHSYLIAFFTSSDTLEFDSQVEYIYSKSHFLSNFHPLLSKCLNEHLSLLIIKMTCWTMLPIISSIIYLGILKASAEYETHHAKLREDIIKNREAAKGNKVYSEREFQDLQTKYNELTLTTNNLQANLSNHETLLNLLDSELNSSYSNDLKEICKILTTANTGPQREKDGTLTFLKIHLNTLKSKYSNRAINICIKSGLLIHDENSNNHVRMTSGGSLLNRILSFHLNINNDEIIQRYPFMKISSEVIREIEKTENTAHPPPIKNISSAKDVLETLSVFESRINLNSIPNASPSYFVLNILKSEFINYINEEDALILNELVQEKIDSVNNKNIVQSIQHINRAILDHSTANPSINDHKYENGENVGKEFFDLCRKNKGRSAESLVILFHTMSQITSDDVNRKLLEIKISKSSKNTNDTKFESALNQSIVGAKDKKGFKIDIGKLKTVLDQG